DAIQGSGARFERAARIHSLAFRIVRVADGTIDGGVAATGPYDWDLVAAHAILNAAGGSILTASGETPRYNRPTPKHDAIAIAGTAPIELLGGALGRPNRSHSA